MTYPFRNEENVMFFFSFSAVKSHVDDAQNGIQILSKTRFAQALCPLCELLVVTFPFADF
jgi:hypothetical protein